MLGERLMNIITESEIYEGIPTLLFYVENSRNNPLVVICHGFNNDKYEGSKIALKLCQEGFTVLCFDIDRHGGRYDGFMELIDSDTKFGTELFRILENTHNDIHKLLEVMSKHDAVNSDEIGLVGISHGANICNYELAHNSKIKVCVSLLGTPNFEDQIVYSMEKESVDDFSSVEEKKLLQYVQALDPRNHFMDKNIICSWLLINGSKDDDVPSRFSESFYNENKYNYNGIIDLIIEDEFHHVSEGMINSTIKWMKKYLLND